MGLDLATGKPVVTAEKIRFAAGQCPSPPMRSGVVKAAIAVPDSIRARGARQRQVGIRIRGSVAEAVRHSRRQEER